MNEGAPKQPENVADIEDQRQKALIEADKKWNESKERYNRDEVRREEGRHLDNMLDEIKLPEGLPDDLVDLYKREYLLTFIIDRENYDNEERHVAKLAEEEIVDIRKELTEGMLSKYRQEFAPKKPFEKVPYNEAA